MKLFLWTDTHYGVKSDSSTFHEYQKKVFDNLILPELLRRKDKIDKIIHLGDFFDKRKQISFQTLQFVKTNILDKLRDFKMDIIVGNHDCAYKNTNDLNSPSLLLDEYPNITVYTKATEVDNVLYIPWINPENTKETLEMINRSTCRTVMGHLELQGYTMFKGAVCDHGLNSDLFNNFDRVFTGHFHTKSSMGNVFYLGCPWDLIFTDADDVKGVHFFDTESLDLEFVENPYKIFNKLFYDDTDIELKDLLLSDKEYTKLKDTFVKVYIKSKSNPVFFDRYCEKLTEASPSSIVYIEDMVKSEDSLEPVSLSEDTLSIIKNSINDYSDLVQTEEKRNSLEKMISELYVKALSE